MLANAGSNAGIYRALLDAYAQRGITSRAILSMDPGSVCHGSFFHITVIDVRFDVFADYSQSPAR